ncbi:MAG: helicase-related protein [Gemmataceae bacterium]
MARLLALRKPGRILPAAAASSKAAKEIPLSRMLALSLALAGNQGVVTREKQGSGSEEIGVIAPGFAWRNNTIFLSLADRSEERRRYLDAVYSVRKGSQMGWDVFDASENVEDVRRTQLLPNVRLANGATADETRRRLLLAFNTPLFPEILIASSVLAEGVDLHLNCRHVIHHNLCWNPSTLEQRTGRVDRLGSQADRHNPNISLSNIRR